MRKRIRATATFESGSRRSGELRASVRQSTRAVFNILRELFSVLIDKRKSYLLERHAMLILQIYRYLEKEEF